MLMQRCRNYHFLWSQSYHWLEMFCLIVCLKSLMQWIDFCKNCFWTITPRKCKWVPWTTFSSYLVKQRTFSSVSFCWPKGNRSFFFSSERQVLCFLNHLDQNVKFLRVSFGHTLDIPWAASFSFLKQLCSYGPGGSVKHVFPIFSVA